MPFILLKHRLIQFRLFLSYIRAIIHRITSYLLLSITALSRSTAIMSEPLSQSPSSTRTLLWNNFLYLLQTVILIALLFATEKLGVLLEAEQRGIMPLFFSSGIALTALLLYGSHLWIAIPLALYLLKFPINIPLIHIGLESLTAVIQVFAALALLKTINFSLHLNTARTVLQFSVIVGIVSPFIGAVIYGVGLILLEIPIPYALQIMLTTWFSAGIGMLIVTSAILTWRTLPVRLNHPWRYIEFVVVFLLLFAVTETSLASEVNNRYMLFYAILPFAIWAAIRFEQHGATAATALIAIILMAGGLTHLNAHAELAPTPQTNNYLKILLEIGFVALTGITAYLVAAAYIERRMAEEEVFAEKEIALATLHAIANAVITTDKQGRINYLNPAAELLTQWSHSQALGLIAAEVVKLKSIIDGRLETPATRSLAGVITPPRQSLLINRENKEVLIEYSVAPIRQRDGAIEGAILVLNEAISDFRLCATHNNERRDRVSYNLSIYNQIEFEHQLNLLLYQTRSVGGEHVLMCLSFAEAKLLQRQSSFMLEEYLRQIMVSLQKRIRQSDILGRLGGDQFVLLLKNCSIVQSKRIAENVLANLEIFEFKAEEDLLLRATTSIGLVGITARSNDAIQLLSQAQIANEHAQQQEISQRIFVQE